MANSETPWGIMDPADSADALAIARKKAYAQALLQQSMEQPASNQMAGRVVVPVSPWQGAAQLGNAYLASKLGGQADTQEADLKQRQYTRQQAIARSLAGPNATPEETALAMNFPDKAAEAHFRKPEAAPDSVREFNFAKANGFAGSYMDWVKAKKEKEETPSSNVKDYQFAKAQGYKGSLTDWMRDVSSAKAGGAASGKADVNNQQDLPRILDKARIASDTIDALINHPGRATLSGWSGVGGLAAKVPASDAARANALLNQVKGQSFLEAYNQLKGGGQITEVEGKKATDAIAALDTAQSDDDFLQALRDLKEVIDIGRKRAERMAGGTPAPAGSPSITPEQARAELARRRAAKK